MVSRIFHGSAFEIVNVYVQGEEDMQERFKSYLVTDTSPRSFEDTRQLFYCQVCDLTLQGRLSYDAHVGGRLHKYRVRPPVKLKKEQPMQRQPKILKLCIGQIDNRMGVMKILRQMTSLPLQQIKDAVDQAPGDIQLQVDDSVDTSANDIKARLLEHHV